VQASADTFQNRLGPTVTPISEHYIAYDVPVAANDSTTLTLGITVEATDVVSVAATADRSELSVNASVLK
jgi:hypothetical protein